MITLHRIHGNGTLLVNPDLIETIEATPDTVITLVNRHRYVVANPVDDVVEQIVAFRARVIAAAGGVTEHHSAGARAIAAVDSNEEQAA